MSPFDTREPEEEPQRRRIDGPVGQDVICEYGWDRVCESTNMSPRESQIARLVFDDQSETEMAGSLGISSHTVHTHLERLYRKVKVGSRVQLIVRVFYEFAPHCQGPRCSHDKKSCPLNGYDKGN